MSHLSNLPSQHTQLVLSQRKSFALMLWIKDFLKHPLDVTGCEFRFVARKSVPTTDFGDVSAAVMTNGWIQNAGQGVVRFDIQAHELDLPSGDYDFAIVMVASGYSATIVHGTLTMEVSVEFSSLSDDYIPAGVNAPETLHVQLQEQHAIAVYAGQALAPGTVSFTEQHRTNLEQLIAEGWNVLANKPTFGSAAFANIEDIALPPGGAPGAALLKSSAANYHTHWAQIAVGGTGLVATGIPANYVPKATGLGTWDWALLTAAVESVAGRTGSITLNADDVAQTAAKFWLSAGGKALLDDLIANGYPALSNRPTLGTASTRADSYFHKQGDVIPNTDLPMASQLKNSSRGTAAPSGGADGHWYRQYS